VRMRDAIVLLLVGGLAVGAGLGGCGDRDGETWIGIWDGGVPDDDTTGDDDTGDDDTSDDDTGDDDSGDDDSGDDDSGDDDTTDDDDTSGDDDTAPVDADGDGYPEDVDCDDNDPDTYPGAPENPLLNLLDQDSDGWTSCDQPPDCDDGNPLLNQDDLDGDTASTCDGDCNDNDATLNLLDLDGDGQDTCSGDCDDSDPLINGLDLDGDGYDSCATKNADCDDTNPDIHPNAGESCGLGIDDDCDGTVDEGCNGCPAYVDIAAVGSAETGEWSDPYLSIPDAIAGTFGVCNELDVVPGTYPDPISVSGRAMTLRGIDGAAATIIDAGLSATAISWTVGSLTLEGFTVTHGSGLDGGGLSLIQSSAAIRDCVFEDNHCSFTGNGGAIHATQSPGLTVRDTIVRGNHCGSNAPDNGGNGGGIYAADSVVHLEALTVVSNTAGDGGGISLHHCSGELRQSLVANNVASDTDPGLGLHRGGGGLLIDGGTVAVDNLLLVDNASDDRGGGLLTVATGGNVTVTNCTIAYNDATAGGAGVHLDPTGSVTLRNTIVAFNDGAAGIDADAAVDAPVQAYCDVYGNTAVDYGANVPDLTGVAGNLAVDPLFVQFSDNSDPLDDDWHLDVGSLCIDEGDPSAAFDDPDGSRNDMGAYGGPDGDW